jgi:hypothetical protein
VGSVTLCFPSEKPNQKRKIEWVGAWSKRLSIQSN